MSVQSELNLEGKNAVVTGGSRGIGAAVALQLARQGARVSITYLNSVDAAQDVLDTIVQRGGFATAIQADHGTIEGARAGIADAVASLGSLDILVNNVGVGWIAPLTELPDEQLELMLNINFHGVIYSTQEALRHISDGGRVITIGSCVGSTVHYQGASVYAATKSGLIGFTKALSRDLGPRKITANVIEPGPVATEGTPPVGEFANMLMDHTSLGRFADASEIARLVGWVATDQADFMTGAVVQIDGGWSA